MTATVSPSEHGRSPSAWQPSARTAWLFAMITGLAVVAVLAMVFRSPAATSENPNGAIGSTAQASGPGPVRAGPTSSATGGTDGGDVSGSSSSSGASGTGISGIGAGAPFAGELPALGIPAEGGTGSPSGQSSGLASAPSGETGAITSAVSDPPGTVTSVLVPRSNPTYAVVVYGGSTPILVLLQQGGGISAAGDDRPSSAGAAWTELGEGSSQLPCIYSLPLSVVSALAGMMQFCG